MRLRNVTTLLKRHFKVGVRARGALLVPACLIASALAVALSDSSAADTEADRLTVWDGVYTTDQAVRGKAYYEAYCSECHEPNLLGRHGFTALRDEVFMDSWGGYTLYDYFARKRETMPPLEPASLADDIYLDVTAYVLLMNGFPAGNDPVNVDRMVRIAIQPKEGPVPLRDFELVRVVGCLSDSRNGVWVLRSATEPVRTRSPDPSSGEELRDSRQRDLGAQTFELRNVHPSPESYQGHRVEVKGFLTLEQGRINVNALQTLDSACGA